MRELRVDEDIVKIFRCYDSINGVFHFTTKEDLFATKRLKVLRSDLATRPRFDNGIDAFSTPSSTLEAPSSWPPRPASTILRPTCVADRVAPFQACSPSTHLGDRVVTPIMTSGTSSPMSSMAVTEGGGVGCAFWKGRAYILKAMGLYFENTWKLSQIVDKLSRNVDNLPYPKPICPEILRKCPIMLIKCHERIIKTLPLFIVWLALLTAFQTNNRFDLPPPVPYFQRGSTTVKRVEMTTNSQYSSKP